jgi:hypothetical protein
MRAAFVAQFLSVHLDGLRGPGGNRTDTHLRNNRRRVGDRLDQRMGAAVC